MVRDCRGKMLEEAPRSLAHNEGTLYTVFKLLVIISSESFHTRLTCGARAACVWATSVSGV